jgi:RimJ/RimL family protein N-acetyltransferase
MFHDKYVAAAKVLLDAENATTACVVNLDRPEPNEEAGAMCFLQRDSDPEVLELGFAFAPQARGRGYAYEAARGVLAFGFGHLHARSVIALTDPFNAPSIVLINKLGMRFDRVVRMKRGQRGADVLRYVSYGEEEAA